jgi:hypothetical protein
MRSIARRIASLEMALSPQSEPEPWHGWRRRRSRGPTPQLRVRFGNLRRLPEDYQGERHVEIAERLPDKNGYECVEFAEVPGPDPILPPQDPRLPKYQYLDFIWVGTEEPQ